jgi:transposase
MSRSSPFVVTLSGTDRAELQRRARCYTAPHAEVVRAKIVLLAAGGLENTVIAERLGVHVGVVSRWRRRFAEEGLDGLADRKRSGRPRVYADAVAAEVKAMACEPPEDRGVPQSRWPAADLAAQAAAEGLVESVVRSMVARWLDADAIRPWRYRSWIFPRDPQFEVKAARVLDLYQRIWDDAGLGEDEYVLRTDEKSQLQVLSRRHPGLPPAPGRPGKVEFEYERHGTVAYLAAYDVHRARLMGRVEPTTGIAP